MTQSVMHMSLTINGLEMMGVKVRHCILGMLSTRCTTTPQNPVLVLEFCSLDIHFHKNLFALFLVVM